MLNPLVRVGGGPRLPCLEERAQAAVFLCAYRCLAWGYMQEPRQLEAQLTAAPLPGATSGESSGDIEVINCEQENLSSTEAVTLLCAYCRAQHRMLVSGKAIWLIPGFDLQSNSWEPQTQVRGGLVSQCNVLSFSHPHELLVPVWLVAPVSSGALTVFEFNGQLKEHWGGCLGGRGCCCKPDSLLCPAP